MRQKYHAFLENLKIKDSKEANGSELKSAADVSLSSKEALQGLQSRLDNLVLDFNEKSAIQAPSKELTELSMKINIVKTLIQEGKTQKAKEKKEDDAWYGRKDRKLQSKRSEIAENIFKSNRSPDSYSVALQLSPDLDTTLGRDENSHAEGKFETKKELAPLEIETDERFRRNVKQDLQINDQEVLLMLSKSSVEDLISYKLKGDRQRKLFTLDDLRLKHLKVATELKKLQGGNIQFDAADELHSYERLIQKPANQGEFSAVQQHRTLDKQNQSPSHQALALRSGLAAIASPEARKPVIKQFKRFNTIRDNQRTQRPLKRQISSIVEEPEKREHISKLTYLSQSPLRVAHQSKLSRNSGLNENFNVPSSLVERTESLTEDQDDLNQHSKMPSILPQPLSGEPELETNRFKVQYSQEMSEPVFNFGLKLYNFQNLEALSQLLGAAQLPESSPQRLDPSYEHTEFELLRKLYGDHALSRMKAKVSGDKINTRLEQNLLKFEAQTAKTMDMRSPQKVEKPKSQAKEMRRSQKALQMKKELNSTQVEKTEIKQKESFLKKLQDGFKAMINRSALSQSPGGQDLRTQVQGAISTRIERQEPLSEPKSDLGEGKLQTQETPRNKSGFGKIFGGVFPQIGSFLRGEPTRKEQPSMPQQSSNRAVGELSEQDRLRLFRRSRDRGINFVKLNKEVIYSSQKHAVVAGDSPKKDDTLRQTQQSFLPPSVRNIDSKAIDQRAKILNNDVRQFFNDSLISLRLERNQNGELQFNSVDMQLRQRIDKVLWVNADADSEQIAGYNASKVHLQSRCLLNENKLTAVIVKGEHVSTKSYVKRNPYAKTSFIQIVNPKNRWEGNPQKFASLVQDKTYEPVEQPENHDDSLDMLIEDRIRRSGELVDEGKSGAFKPRRHSIMPIGDSSFLQPQRLVKARHGSIGSTGQKYRSPDKSMNKALKNKMPIRNRTQAGISNFKIEQIDEETQSTDGLEGFDTQALSGLNDDLRLQIQAQVNIFEQYLRVAMLQQEQDQLKVVAADSKKKLLNQKSSFGEELKIVTENVKVEQEQITDPSIAMVVAQYQLNSSKKEVSRKTDLPGLLGNAIKVESNGWPETQRLNVNSSVSTRSKPPSRISRQLWQRVTHTMQLENNVINKLQSQQSPKQHSESYEKVKIGLDRQQSDPLQPQETNAQGPKEIELVASAGLKSQKSSEHRPPKKLISIEETNVDLEPSKPSKKQVQNNSFWFKHNGSRESSKRQNVASSQSRRGQKDLIARLDSFEETRLASSQSKQRIKIRQMFNSDSESISLKSKVSRLNGSHGATSRDRMDLGSKDQLEVEREKKKLKLDADHRFFQEYQAMQFAFTRLDANPEAIKDNIKNLLETPFAVSARGKRVASRQASVRAPSRAASSYSRQARPSSKQSSISKRSRQSNSLTKQRAKHTNEVFASKRFDESPEGIKALVERTKQFGNEHAVHVEWIERTQALWELLNSHPAYAEQRSLQNRLKDKRKRLEQLTDDNKYEATIIRARQTLLDKKKEINRSRSPYGSLKEIQKKKKKIADEEKKISHLQEEISFQLARRNQLEEIDLQNLIIKTRLDCRLHENLIYAAQKLKLQPDVKMERTIENLRDLGAKITQEIFEFVREREKTIWRTWEYADSDWLRRLKLKYNCQDGDFTEKQLLEIYYDLLREVTRLERKFDDMMGDESTFEIINADMQQFLSKQLGHRAWISITKTLEYQALLGSKPDKNVLIVVSSDSEGKLNSAEAGARTAGGKEKDLSPKTAGGKDALKGMVSLKEGLNSASSERIFTAAQEQSERDAEYRKNKYAHLADKEAQDQSNTLTVADAQNDQADAVQTLQKAVVGSGWLASLKREERQRNDLLERQKKEREKRLLKLFSGSQVGQDEDSDDETTRLLDQNAAIKNYDETLGRIDKYLRAEMKLLNAWQQFEQIDNGQQ